MVSPPTYNFCKSPSTMRPLPTRDQVPARTLVAIAIFVLCCLLSSLRLTFLAPNPEHLTVDNIAQRSDQRFAALKAALPRRGVIGYIGGDGVDATADYYLAQYALAPLVVDHSANHSLVIGNFASPAPAIPPGSLKLEKDFGDGVLLFSNKDTK